MGNNKKYYSLWDCTQGGLNARARCQNWPCKHEAIFDGSKLLRYLLVRRWSTDLGVTASRLRCLKCRARKARLDPWAGEPDVKWLDVPEETWTRLVKRLRG